MADNGRGAVDANIKRTKKLGGVAVLLAVEGVAMAWGCPMLSNIFICSPGRTYGSPEEEDYSIPPRLKNHGGHASDISQGTHVIASPHIVNCDM